MAAGRFLRRSTKLALQPGNDPTQLAILRTLEEIRDGELASDTPPPEEEKPKKATPRRAKKED